jgi:integrase
MARLALLRDSLQLPVRSEITVKGYAADWQLFNRWCEKAGRVPMPASADTVELYITWMLVDNGRRVSTAARHVSAIAHYHRLAGERRPITPEVKAVLGAVKRQRREKPQGKLAITPEDLRKVSAACGETNAGTRNRAILILGFATSLRRSDLARLELADISYADEGIIIFVRYGKTDQLGRGRILSVWAGKNPLTDPVGVLGKWIERRGTWPGALFPQVWAKGDRVTRQPISGEAIHDAIQSAIKRAGIDPAPYGAHSLRAGAITAAAIAGGTDQEIMRLSGHANASVMRGYIRMAKVFSGRNPLAGVL